MSYTRFAIPRGWFVGIIAGLAVALFGLLVVAFACYPGVSGNNGTGPAPIFPLWFGANGAPIAYGMLAIYFIGLYAVTSWYGTGFTAMAPQTTRQPWQIGAMVGLGTALAVFLINQALNVLPNAGVLTSFTPVILLGGLIGAGVWGGRVTGRVQGGMLAGFWCGIIMALASSVLGLAAAMAFAPLLAQTAWAHDTTCPYTAAQRLAACEISDSLGLYATLLTIFPLLGMGLGALGGLSRTTIPGTPSAFPKRVLVVPIIFLVLQSAMFVGELIWNYW